MKDLQYLDSHWSKLKEIKANIKNNLAKMKKTKKTKNGNFKFLKIVDYSDVDKSWHPGDLGLSYSGYSKTLQILADRICYMIDMGMSPNIKPMLEKIATGRIKTHYQINKDFPKRESWGKGHFRADWSVHTLTKMELERLKEFFEL